MDIVVNQGDQLVIEIDVVDEDEAPLNLTGADVRYKIDDLVNYDENNVNLEIIDGLGTKSRVRITVPITFSLGRYRQECKVRTTDVGPATILPGTIFVEPSLIGADV